ncbi:MAG: urease accessory protein UreD [Aliidongia sp.]
MQAPCSTPPALQRAAGALRLQTQVRDGRSVLRSLYQQAPCRALMPDTDPGAPFEAVLVNTSGGLVGGDRLDSEIEIGPGAAAILTSQAAEKLYRSTGAETRVETRLSVGAGAWAEWLPQETILFDGARLRRRLVATLAPDARLLAAEIVLFGRAAHGESFTRGFLHDSWAIRRGDRLAWTDAIRLEGDIAAERSRAFGFGRAAGYATLLHAGPAAASFLPVARDIAASAPAEGGATLVNGLLLLRFLADDPAQLRQAVVIAAGGLRAAIAGLPRALPRVWQV